MSKRLIPDSVVAARYGRHVCTLTRWERDPELAFPKRIQIRGRNYRDEAELDAFDKRQRDVAGSTDMLKLFQDSRESKSAAT
jgi:hypothetical protein